MTGVDGGGRALHAEPPASIAGGAGDIALLRAWRSDDRAPFAAMNADPLVMRHFPSVLTSEQSDALVDRIVSHHVRHGFGLWAVDIDGRFAGFVGLSTVAFEAPFTPAIEIGWRLAPWAWGRGVATTTARRILQSAPGAFGITELVSFTTLSNEPSMAVMTRIGMHRDVEGDFDHPRVDVGSPLRRHVLYRWSAQHSAAGIGTVPR